MSIYRYLGSAEERHFGRSLNAKQLLAKRVVVVVSRFRAVFRGLLFVGSLLSVFSVLSVVVVAVVVLMVVVVVVVLLLLSTKRTRAKVSKTCAVVGVGCDSVPAPVSVPFPAHLIVVYPRRCTLTLSQRLTMKKSTSAPRRMGEVEAIVNRRLNSQWGRPTSMRSSSSFRSLASPSSSSSPSSASPPLPSKPRPSLVSRPVNQLRRMIERESPRWTDVLDRCWTHPREVVQLDSRSRTCLSSACAKNPPIAVVRAMLAACQFGMEATCDKTGLTALTIAIQHQASLDVVCALAKSKRMVETRDHRANTPMHLLFLHRYKHGIKSVCTALVAASPQLANMNNYDGKTPVHIAIETRASTDAIRTVLAGKQTPLLAVPYPLLCPFFCIGRPPPFSFVCFYSRAIINTITHTLMRIIMPPPPPLSFPLSPAPHQPKPLSTQPPHNLPLAGLVATQP